MLCTPTSNTVFFDDIGKIPNKIWEDLSIENEYLKLPYLRSVQKNHSENRPYYMVIKSKEKAIAIATLQIIDFYIDSFKSDYQNLIKNLKKFSEKLHLLKDDEKLRILVCGNPFVSGEHGISINPNADKKQILAKVVKAITELVESKKELKKTVDVFLLKDFLDQSLSYANTVKKHHYHPFSVEPNMVLSLRESWTSFEDYLSDFKTKYRVKAKRALALSESLKVVKITTENFAQYKNSMHQLYESVVKSASFNLADFNIDTYKDFLISFDKNYIIQSYFLEDKMVGFISGLINNNTLDAHFVGIDYKFNKRYAIYQRMLYDCVNIGINHQIETINFGRTASEIKSSIGAIPQELTLYVRHKKTIPNKLLKLFLQNIEPTSFQQKKPFKQPK